MQCNSALSPTLVYSPATSHSFQLASLQLSFNFPAQTSSFPLLSTFQDVQITSVSISSTIGGSLDWCRSETESFYKEFETGRSTSGESIPRSFCSFRREEMLRSLAVLSLPVTLDFLLPLNTIPTSQAAAVHLKPGSYTFQNVKTGQTLFYSADRKNHVFPKKGKGTPTTVQKHSNSKLPWHRFSMGKKNKCLSSAWGSSNNNAAVMYVCASGQGAQKTTLEKTKQYVHSHSLSHSACF